MGYIPVVDPSCLKDDSAIIKEVICASELLEHL